MPLPLILVTGANGQLGSVLKALSASYPQFRFAFPGRADLPIDNAALIQEYFKKETPAFCINCAAYTAVDKAETEKELAMLVNGTATGMLATACKLYNTKLVHISTDYVFDGTATKPYKESDPTNPVNYYGATKLAGETQCLQQNSESIIMRTSWVYAEPGNNFVKTMLRLMKERPSLNVVNDQQGSPTYAVDLATQILSVITTFQQGKTAWVPGIYHYSNDGNITWFDFALAIKKLTGSNCEVKPVPTTMFPTPARRPAYSVMDKQKIQAVYHATLVNWQDSLAICIKNLQKQA